MIKAQFIHLLLEETARAEAPPQIPLQIPVDPAEDATASWRIEIPEGVNYVLTDGDGRLRLVQDLPEETSGLFLVEQVWQDRAARLLVLNIGSVGAMVNGNPAPPVVLLGEGDEIVFGPAGECTAHVTVFSSQQFGPPPAEAVGKSCGVCLGAFTEEDRTFACPTCHTIYHCHSEERPEESRLRCAREGRICMVCLKPMKFAAGYSYIPDSFRGH